jgi:hypothetical protein
MYLNEISPFPRGIPPKIVVKKAIVDPIRDRGRKNSRKDPAFGRIDKP